MQGWCSEGVPGILACSALKAKYRETLAAGMPAGTVSFVLLEGSPELIAERLATRNHEYMNPNLLASQLKTLETPSDAEAFRIVNDKEPAVIVEEILSHVNLSKSIESAGDSVQQ